MALARGAPSHYLNPLMGYHIRIAGPRDRGEILGLVRELFGRDGAGDIRSDGPGTRRSLTLLESSHGLSYQDRRAARSGGDSGAGEGALRPRRSGRYQIGWPWHEALPHTT